MKIDRLVIGPFEVNCYLYWNEPSRQGVIIDPGDEGERIGKAIERLNVTPLAILLTHGHSDHIGAVEYVKKRYDLSVYIGRGEEELLVNPDANLSSFLGQPIFAPPADFLLDDEQPLEIGDIKLRVLSTPGHSPGGVSFLDEKAGVLFCGDTLFYGSIGRTDFPGSSHQLLLSSIKNKILSLPNSVICYPGHGPETTVGGERVNNPFLIGETFA